MASNRVTRSSKRRKISQEENIDINQAESKKRTFVVSTIPRQGKRGKTKKPINKPLTTHVTCSGRDGDLSWTVTRFPVPPDIPREYDDTIDRPACLWSVMVTSPIIAMVYDSSLGYLWVRLGDMRGVWRTHVTMEGQLKMDGDSNTPQNMIPGIADGYGLCLDPKRQRIVLDDKRNIMTFDYEGNLIRQFSLAGLINIWWRRSCV